MGGTLLFPVNIPAHFTIRNALGPAAAPEIGILMVALAVFALILLLTGIVLIVRMFFPEAFCSRMDTLRNGKY